jgi:hypothetical protein
MTFNKKAILILAALIFFHALSNFYILRQSRLADGCDKADYIDSSVFFNKLLRQGSYGEVFEEFFLGRGYRKLFPLIGGLWLTLLGQSDPKVINLMILLTNAVFLSVLLFSVFKIGAILFNQKAGLLAAALLSFSPKIFGYSRVSLVDFPLAAMVALSLWCLLKTDNFKSLLFSLVTGVVFILAQFTRETAVVFITPPFLYYAFNSLSIRDYRWQRILNFAIVCLLWAVPAIIAYNSQGNQGIADVFWQKTLIPAHDNEFFYYLTRLPIHYLGWLFFIALLPLILCYGINIKKRSVFLALWLFVPVLVFSLSPNRITRFLIPGLPALFLLLSFELFHSFAAVRRVYAAVLIAVAALQYAAFSFYPKSPLFTTAEDDEWGLLCVKQDKDFYSAQELIRIFKSENTGTDKKNKVIATFDFPFLSSVYSRFKMDDMPFFIDMPQGYDGMDTATPVASGKINWQEYLLTADYVLDKTGDLGNLGIRENIAGQFKHSLEINYYKFKKIAEFRAQDGETIYVYRKKVP